MDGRDVKREAELKLILAQARELVLFMDSLVGTLASSWSPRVHISAAAPDFFWAITALISALAFLVGFTLGILTAFLCLGLRHQSSIVHSSAIVRP